MVANMVGLRTRLKSFSMSQKKSLLNDKTALILGITGQDGSYLAEFLISKGYRVIGLTRDPAARFTKNVAHLQGKVELIYSSYQLSSLVDLLNDILPSEIYNCTGQTYVSKSWEMLSETFQASALLPAFILEAIIRINKNIKYFQASSCEIFTLNENEIHTEKSLIAPANPYGCSKAFAQNMVVAYRKNYSVFAVSGILFHHESPRRHEDFASRKIVKRAVEIKLGKKNELVLGNLEVSRDWGYSPDFVRAMYQMLQMPEPLDFVICTGEIYTLQNFVQTVFNLLELDYREYVKIDAGLYRYSEPMVIRGSNARAKAFMDWKPNISFNKMLQLMVDYETRLQTGKEKDYENEHPF